MADLLLLNGPNLGILGRRQPEIYGEDTLRDIERMVQAEISGQGWGLISVQYNDEGRLIDAIEAGYGTVAAIVNPGALMIAGWGLRDALASYPRPWIEVHISNIWARESFRHESVLAPLASGVVVGLGSLGYRLAARALVQLVAGSPRPDPQVLLDGRQRGGAWAEPAPLTVRQQPHAELP
jgi:5-deoxy-5-amino-3-dehydroquinate dehydratase